MKRIMISLAVATALAGPVAAQEQEEGAPAEDGGSLMERGARMFLEGMLREMEPALKELEGMADEIEPALRDFARQMGPALAELLGKIDDLSNYYPPEMLPNGDIIIRRKVPLTPSPGPMPEEEIEI